jgi:intracellular septation protein A
MAAASDYIARARGFVRERGLSVGLELLVNFILPFLIYNYGEKPLGQVHALMASSGPPIAWTIIEFARHRRVDALSMLVLAGIGLSLLAYLGGGSVRFLQLREKLVTVTIGLVFLGSAAIGRPLIYQLARATIQRRNPAELGDFEAMRDNVFFRRTMTVMTLVWGAGLVAEAAVAAVLVLTLSVRQYLLVAPVVGYGAMGVLSLWTFWYARRARRRGEARQAAEAASAPPAGVSP